LASRLVAESQIVHHGGGEEQLLVVSHIVHAALVFGKQAREQETSDAVVNDRARLCRPDQRQARVDERPRREREGVFHATDARLLRSRNRLSAVTLLVVLLAFIIFPFLSCKLGNCSGGTRRSMHR